MTGLLFLSLPNAQTKSRYMVQRRPTPPPPPPMVTSPYGGGGGGCLPPRPPVVRVVWVVRLFTWVV